MVEDSELTNQWSGTNIHSEGSQEQVIRNEFGDVFEKCGKRTFSHFMIFR